MLICEVFLFGLVRGEPRPRFKKYYAACRPRGCALVLIPSTDGDGSLRRFFKLVPVQDLCLCI
jgi:hypothetical protein